MNTRLSSLLPEILAEIDRDKLIVPSTSYEIVAVEKAGAGTISLDSGDLLKAPLLAHRLAQSSHILLGVTTIGSTMAKAVRQCFMSGKYVKAILMEELANSVLFQTSNTLQSLAEERAGDMGLKTSGPLSPGDHDGFGLDQQATVLVLAGAEKIGVSMTKTGQMNPVHSISVVIGLGKHMRKWARIDDCKICRSRDKCRHYLYSRRRPTLKNQCLTISV